MTKDFKDPQNKDTPLNDIVSWILAGIALGLFVALMIYLFSGNPSQTTEQSSAKPSDSTLLNASQNSKTPLTPEEKQRQERLDKMAELDRVVEDNLSKAEDDPRPTFNYHVILPTLDVEVPVTRPTDWHEQKKSSSHHKSHKSAEKHNQANKKEQTKTSTNKNNVRYIIQVGSYQNKAEAEKMRRKVSSLGRAYIEAANIKGKTWYRVRIGPIADTSKVNKIKSTLSARGIASFKRAIN